MKKLLTIFILSLSNLIFAQESKESNWILKLNATQLVDIVSYPTLQISSKPDTIFLKSKGFKANLEGRIYLFKMLHSRIQSKRNEFYVGLQLFYRENENTNSLDYSLKNDETKFYTDNLAQKEQQKVLM
jgi:hypothetical protein